MTAPLRLTQDDLERLAIFLGALTAASLDHDCTITGINTVQVRVTPLVDLAIVWDAENEQYVIDDMSGL